MEPGFECACRIGGIAAAAKQIPFDALNRGCITSGDSFFVGTPLGSPELRTGPHPRCYSRKLGLSAHRQEDEPFITSSNCFLNTVCHAYCAKCWKMFDSFRELESVT